MFARRLRSLRCLLLVLIAGAASRLAWSRFGRRRRRAGLDRRPAVSQPVERRSLFRRRDRRGDPRPARARAAVPRRRPRLVGRVRQRRRRARGRAPAQCRLCRRRQRPPAGRPGRVNADLVRASDGIRLWSDSYDGKLDDIFAIQQRIGGAIAGALRRKLIRTPTLSGPLVTNGEAYNLYLTARGLIRTRNTDVFVTASNLLRDAIKLDPNYAPAWASLAESTYLEDYPDGSEGLIAALPRADGYARHALQLAPDLAEAHRVLGVLLPYGSPEALSHLRRAVELDPNNAEALIGLGSGAGGGRGFRRGDGRLQARPGARPCLVQDDRAAGDQARRDGAARRSRGDRERRASPTTQPICTSSLAASPGSSAIFRRRQGIGRSPRGRIPRAGVRGLEMGVADVRMRRRH